MSVRSPYILGDSKTSYFNFYPFSIRFSIWQDLFSTQRWRSIWWILLETGRTAGNIYRCLVLRSDNQKLKVRDAWTWVHGNFNLRFIHSSPTHTAAAVKAKAANWDVWRHLLYGTKNFFLAKRLENCLVSSFERRDETRRLETNFTVWGWFVMLYVKEVVTHFI